MPCLDRSNAPKEMLGRMGSWRQCLLFLVVAEAFHRKVAEDALKVPCKPLDTEQ